MAKKTVKQLQSELKALGVVLTGKEKSAELEAMLVKSTPGPVGAVPGAVLPPANDPADQLDKEIDKDTAAPEGVKTGKTGVVRSETKEVFEDLKTKVKTITPTGKFESVGSLIFNEFGVHAGTEPSDNEASKKANSFNTTRRFR